MRVQFVGVTVALFASVRASAQVQTFQNDYPGFVNAAGPLAAIDFETLPNGQPSSAGVQITPDFNYDLQGANFSAPVGNPYIAGGPGAFELRTYQDSPTRTWISAAMTNPGRAVGIFFPGHTTLCAYAVSGTQLGCASWGGGGSGLFLGIVSPATPIARVTVDRGSNGDDIESFLFSPVPEPATAVLLFGGCAFVFRRRWVRERSRAGG